MKRWILGLLLPVLSACLVPRSQLDRAKEETNRCYEALGQENNKKKDLSVQKAQLEEEKKKLAEENATYDELLASLKEEMKDKLIQVSKAGNHITVNVSERILFDSGNAEVKDSGKAALQKIAGILAKVKDKRIDIEGHTDNVPITGELTKTFPTNWELSAARATGVVRFLESQGVDPSRMAAVGKSKYRPLTSNKTSQGRALNRRIDIVLTPWDIPK